MQDFTASGVANVADNQRTGNIRLSDRINLPNTFDDVTSIKTEPFKASLRDL